MREITGTVRINDLDVGYEVVYRPVQCPRLEFREGYLRLILPWGFRDINGLLDKHKRWIYKETKFIQETLQGPAKKKLRCDRSDEEFHTLVHSCVDMFFQKRGIRPLAIKFRKMSSRWGSCDSEKKIITLNTYLQYVPDTIIRYVVFHELCHLMRRNHDKKFWDLVSYEFPEYKTLRRELLGYWYLILESQKMATL